MVGPESKFRVVFLATLRLGGSLSFLLLLLLLFLVFLCDLCVSVVMF
jgi:hypothetical protein